MIFCGVAAVLWQGAGKEVVAREIIFGAHIEIVVMCVM